MGRLTAAARRALPAVALVVLAVGPATVGAAEPVEFGTPVATASFAQPVRFEQPVTLGEAPARIEVLVTVAGAAGPLVEEVSGQGPGERTLSYTLPAGHVVPNTPYLARWRITAPDGTVTVGPEVRVTTVDDRFEWQTVEGDRIRLHWVEGGPDFGERALRIGEEAVAEATELLGTSEDEPIDLFVYADREAFYDALGPSTRDNVGGQAHPSIRTLFALITPGQINAGWVEIVVPHELLHIVFATATENPYRGAPHWLDEGLAVYLSQGYAGSDRGLVRAAARDGTLMPLGGLAGAFPTSRERFFLAYAESISAVDRIVRVHGRDALVALIGAYRAGVTDDEAFRTALGEDLAAFEAGWLAELGAVAPVRHGPQPAPVGPLPDGWSGPAVVPSLVPGAGPTVAPGSPARPSDGGALSATVVLALAAAVTVAVVGVVVFARRRAMGEWS